MESRMTNYICQHLSLLTARQSREPVPGVASGVLQEGDTVHFLVFEVSPDQSSPDHGQVGGAFASCWVATDDTEVAEREARALLEDNGWRVRGGPPDECYPVTRDRYEADEAKLARFDRAATEGVLVTLHTWPVGAEH
jgi:hypothetical protein